MIPFHNSGGNSVGLLVAYLSERRDMLLDNWHAACNADVSLKGPPLSRENFVNRVPAMLNLLGRRLKGQADEADFDALAAEHGFHRWQKGYTLSDLVAEMQHLGRLLLSELRTFWISQPQCNAGEMAFSYEHLSEFRNQINTGSISQYADLQRQAALNRIETLQKTLAELNELGKQRTDLLRHSSHDLRGSFGALQGAATLLEMVIDSDGERQRLLEIVRRNLMYCRTLITQLLDMARLEAGQETANIQPMDAGQLLTDLVKTYQPLANHRGLVLTAAGPANFPVECDPVQLQRIVQNLLFNAIKHTQSGWVSVSWARIDDCHWGLVVQDSGPGLPAARATGPIATATENSGLRDITFAHRGEGIGLSIVKGLCELLQGSLDIKSKQGQGTTFRIKLAIGRPS